MKNISGDLDVCSITGRHCDSDSWMDCAACGANKLRCERALLQHQLTTAKGIIANMEKSMEAVARERDEAREQLTDMLKLMLPRPAGEPALVADQIDVPLTGSPLVLRLVESMVSMLNGKGPGNFHAISFRSAKDGQEYSLTIQREGGKTPAQRITELETEVAGLRRKIGEWADEIEAGQFWPGLLAEMRGRLPGCAEIRDGERKEECEVKIKKCPFCAFQSPFVTSSIRAGIRPGDGFVVLCDFQEGGCGATGGVRASESEAIEAWNQRKKREAMK